jgi:hypothetical protein
MTDEMTLVEEAGTPHPGPLPIAPQRGEGEKVKWTEHPLVDELPEFRKRSDEELADLEAVCGREAAMEYVAKREQRIARSVSDPLRFGFELGHWKQVREFLSRKNEVFALGGNGSAKTELGAKLVVECLCNGRGHHVLCIAQDDTASKRIQQTAVYKYLPKALRRVNESGLPRRRSAIGKTAFSEANGFSDGILVLPTRSKALFKTVAQFEQSETGKKSFEGMDFDFYWPDEPMPMALFRAIQRRSGKRDGKIFATFTALFGHDAVCSQILDGARIIKTLPMNWRWRLDGSGYVDETLTIPMLSLNEIQVKGCPPGHMPFIVQPLNMSQVVIFMWTHWNVFLPNSKEYPGWPAYFEKCLGQSKQTVRTWLFGWTERVSGSQIPNFIPKYYPEGHIIPHAEVEKLLKEKKLTTYMADDPHTARSHATQWKGVAAPGIDDRPMEYIFDESPRIEEGEWASADGLMGDGQRVYAEEGVDFYKKHFREREREHGQPAFRRKGDPRAFATEQAAAGGGTTYFELFERDEVNGDKDLEPMYFEPAKVRRLTLLGDKPDIAKITDALAFNPNKPVDAHNHPHLLISDRCQNTIRAWINWDGKNDSPWKDFVDVSRYNFDEPAFFIDPDMPESMGGRGWGAR